METSENTVLTKKTSERERSAAYPGISVQDAFNFTLEVLKHFPTKDRIVTRADIATVLETGESTILRDISAAVQFGFFTKVKEGYYVSQLSRQIKDPLDENEKRRLFVTAFKAPKLYQQLIEKFDGYTVPEELKVHLIRFFGIAEKAAPVCAEVFIDSARFCGVLSDNRVLDVNHSIQSAEVLPNQETIKSEDGNKDVSPIDITPKEEPSRPNFLPALTENYDDVKIRVTNNKFIFLKYPVNLNKKDIAVLRKEIEKIELLIDD